ncbi:ATP-binding cassette domain-containing protein [Salipaludibacillus agaradhaerens]|uniref:ATP-binding cassette domain-containing protein n=1 Tax=Salipaludibacillus agaradhaerens TaxID=76935 RepID=A0A9Q4FZT0_SALAG|nr:ATP-binding cassette domain-containing protein [Salipaludibacillus agaradhaerens]MCR6097756.1 ATP-binding cassette domain-containing protein [Salipaludibacillus agaradhaerens]MCR6112760.1 ATP-binding cassette domain-containing protein [Salipaludibacillus agaradhaerens]
MFKLSDVKFKDVIYIKELHIPPKTTTCIIGESGSGKSTLIKLLNHLISCDQGEVTFQGKPIVNIDPIKLRRQVIMVPQVPVTFEGTIQDNLLIGLAFAEKPQVDQEKLKEVLRIVHLSKPLDTNADQLSGGEKQRLSLARALLLDPEVFIFDEPTSALDEQTEDKVIEGVIREIKNNHKTLIMVTHSQKIANTYGEFIAVMKAGNIIEVKGAG